MSYFVSVDDVDAKPCCNTEDGAYGIEKIKGFTDKGRKESVILLT